MREAKLFTGARRRPVARFTFARHGALHGVAVYRSLVIERDMRFDVERDVLAVDRSFEGAGLARPFECSGNFCAVLLEHDGLLGAAPAPDTETFQVPATFEGSSAARAMAPCANNKMARPSAKPLDGSFS